MTEEPVTPMPEEPVPPVPEEPVSFMPEEATSDDRLWAALAYLFTPLIPIVILLLEDKKNRPFIKAHNMQALVWGVVFYLIVVVTSFFVIGFCVWGIGLLLEVYWAYRAFKGQTFDIPVISNLVRNQGWA